MAIQDNLLSWIRTRIGEQSLSDEATYDASFTLPHRGYCLPTFYHKTGDDSAAGDTLSDQFFGYIDRDITLTGVYYLADGALTADDTNYATLHLKEADNAGGSTSDVATVLTTTGGSGNWTGNTAISFTISSANVDSGQTFHFSISKSGTGVIVTSGRLIVYYDLR